MPRASRCAFTAIEMLAVLALMAIVAASASLSLSSLQRTSDVNGVVDRIKYFDALTRQQNLRSGRPQMLSFGEQAIERRDINAAPADAALATLQLPAGFLIERVMIAPSRAAGSTVQPTVRISGAGLSPTYAILLDHRGQRQWMIISAVGQVRQLPDDGNVEDEMDHL